MMINLALYYWNNAAVPLQMKITEWTITTGEGDLLAFLSKEKPLTPSHPWTEGDITTMTTSSQTEGFYIMTMINTGNICYILTLRDLTDKFF